MRFRQLKRYGRVALFGMGLTALSPPVSAQVPEGLQALAARCAAPGGADLPECQAARTTLEQSRNPNELTDSTAVPLVRTGPASAPARPATAERPSLPADDNSLPAEAPTEFQRLVASSFGRILPLFGARLFDSATTTFAPVEQVPAAADSVVGPGDEILLRTWGQVTLNLSLTVDRSGSVYIPQAGSVHVAGLTYGQLTGHLRTSLARVYRNFELSVTMGQLHSIQVFVVGSARRPGTYTVSSVSTLVSVLFAAGGPSSQGSMRRIKLIRGSAVVTEFDVYDLLLKGDKTRDARLLPGDVIHIEGVGPQVAVAGSVRNPAVYELKGETSVGTLLALAGGLTPVADGRRASLERIRDRAVRETAEIALDGPGLAAPARDGDLLIIRTVLPRFDNAVTLRGNVSNPGRFAWRAGMRLRDVIPEKGSLITRDYWKKKNVSGFTPPDEAIASEPGKEKKRQPSRMSMEDVEDINWSYALIERQSARDLSAQLLPFDLGKLLLDGDDHQNLELQPGDVITIFSQSDIRVPVSQQNRRVRLEGEFKAAGVYNVKPGETLGQLIQRVGGLTPDAYLYASEFQRESTRLEQQRRLEQYTMEMEREIEQFGATKSGGISTPEESAALAARLDSQRKLAQRMRALPLAGRIVLGLEPGSNDMAKLMNVPLEDGDRFVVPPRSATINVLGSVYNPNSFLHEAKLRLADYLQEAGGVTRTGDKGRIFIIRADGSVMPHQGGGLFKKSFDAALLSPGDAVVVPEQMPKTPFMKGFRDWTQVFSNLALGAAAINVLK
ncbi:SLBB domain-containing protein [uncultured Paludibaculum sp.]|uniref:SLBB domain-containing protein n=1 Tax=uncultured Paludibaculum sp. TaxID=1765020 RepID=UPI002AAAE25F|nr:SLBB domain-containing protein [uncultured Paludibaculum sp.]